MKAHYTLSSFLICLLLSANLNAQEVVNGGFELSNPQGMARNWITDDANGKLRIGLTKNQFRSGKASLELGGTSVGEKPDGIGIAANLYGSSSATRVKSIRLSGWAKSSGKLDSVSLFVQNGAKIIRVKGTSSSRKGWNKLVLTYNIPDTESWYRFYYGIELNSNQLVWLDDLALSVNGKKIQDPISLYREPKARELAWLSRNISPVQLVAAGKPDGNLSLIGKAIGSARIIGVGEPTHGTSEVSRLKLSLLEYMVEHKGFTTLALEESIASCDQMNRLLNTENPALKDSLTNMPFYKLWKTREMLEMLVWVNQYNLSHQKKIKFIGIDSEDLGMKSSRRMLRDYGERNSMDIYLQTRTVDKSLDSLILLSRSSMDNEKTIGAANQLKRNLERLDSLVLVEANHAGRQTAFELSSYVRVCRQWVDTRFFRGNRDQFMAENINSYLEANPDEKIFLWAHNFHAANVNKGGQRTMGGFLKEKYGDGYFPLSITLGAGTYMAAADPSQKSWKSYKLEQPYLGTYEYIFSKMLPGNYFLDLSTAKGSAASWLEIPMKQLDLGYIYAGEEHYQYHGVLGQSFDGVLFIRNSAASHSLIN
ncbi:MAG: erythromycin esterase family protein [Pedobacter sp.]|nr:MAG: erythromycin esterase family protein [Pedobacter sp.]